MPLWALAWEASASSLSFWDIAITDIVSLAPLFNKPDVNHFSDATCTSTPTRSPIGDRTALRVAIYNPTGRLGHH
jgi:hypothetical protein